MMRVWVALAAVVILGGSVLQAQEDVAALERRCDGGDAAARRARAEKALATYEYEKAQQFHARADALLDKQRVTAGGAPTIILLVLGGAAVIVLVLCLSDRLPLGRLGRLRFLAAFVGGGAVASLAGQGAVYAATEWGVIGWVIAVPLPSRVCRHSCVDV